VLRVKLVGIIKNYCYKFWKPTEALENIIMKI
jgi:hypothetical protein